MRYLMCLATLITSQLTAVEEVKKEEPKEARTLNVYTHPGIVVSQDGKWVGSDHLLNLSNKIDVIVEILKPETTKLPFTEESLEQRIEAAFKKKDFETSASRTSAMPHIPFFNVLLVIYPIEKGYVGLVDGRLMESIDPKRVKLEKNTDFQAITWEKKTLVVAPTDEFEGIINKTIDDILATFFERFEFFEKLRVKMEKKDETQRMK